MTLHKSFAIEFSPTNITAAAFRKGTYYRSCVRKAFDLGFEP